MILRLFGGYGLILKTLLIRFCALFEIDSPLGVSLGLIKSYSECFFLKNSNITYENITSDSIMLLLDSVPYTMIVTSLHHS